MAEATGYRLGMLTYVNDPSAGSPTETLLRLLLPLDIQICRTSDSGSVLTPSPDSSERLIETSNR